MFYYVYCKSNEKNKRFSSAIIILVSHKKNIKKGQVSCKKL